MVRADSDGETWVFPETAELLETKEEQILAKKVLVQYVGNVRIRCKILSKTLIAEIKSTLLFKNVEMFSYYACECIFTLISLFDKVFYCNI